VNSTGGAYCGWRWIEGGGVATGEDNTRKNYSAFTGSQHFEGKKSMLEFGIRIKKIDKQLNYSHKPTQTKQQVR
jgi:hypothetical protein